MNSFWLIGLTLMLVSSVTQAGEVVQKQLVHQGIIRQYRVYIPTHRTTQMPVVMVFHGGRGDSKKIMEMTGFNGLADIHRALIVYPDGIESRSAYGDRGQHWNDGRISGVAFDDVGFVEKILNNLEAEFDINTFKIYATGLSNGGMFTLRLATELGSRFAAIASVVGLMPAPLKGKLNKSPLPFLLIAGDEDPIMPFHGGRVKSKISGEILSATATMSEFKKQCTPNAKATQRDLPNRNFRDGSEVQLTKINDKAGCDIRFYHIKGGGHGYPGKGESRGLLRDLLMGNTNLDFSASETIMDFFISSQPAAL